MHAIDEYNLNIQANNKDVLPSDMQQLYRRQLGNFATTKKKENTALLERKKIPVLDVIDGKATRATIGANRFKKASVIREDKDMMSDPFVVETEDSSLGAQNSPHAIGGFLDTLSLQKDEVIALMLDNKGTADGASIVYDGAAFTEKVLNLIKSQKTKEGSKAGIPELIIAEDIFLDLLGKKVTGTDTNLWQDFLSTVSPLIQSYRISSLIGGRVYALDGRNVVEMPGFDPFLDRIKEEDPDSAITNTNYRFIWSTADMAVEVGDALLYQEFTGVVMNLSNKRFEALKATYIVPENTKDALNQIQNELKTVNNELKELEKLGDKVTAEQKVLIETHKNTIALLEERLKRYNK